MEMDHPSTTSIATDVGSVLHFYNNGPNGKSFERYTFDAPGDWVMFDSRKGFPSDIATSNPPQVTCSPRVTRETRFTVDSKTDNVGQSIIRRSTA